MIMKPPSGILEAGHPLSYGLAGYWPMLEGGGNIINDLSGNGGYGYLVNGPQWIKGPDKPVIKLDKTQSQYIQINPSPTLNNYSALTVEIKCYLYGSVGTPWGGDGIVSQINKGYGSTCDWAIEFSTYEGYESISVTSCPNYSTWWSNSINDGWQVPGTFSGKWNTYVFTIGNSVYNTYINGLLVKGNVARTPNTFCNSGQPLYIGTSADKYSYGSLIVDNLKIWNCVLSASEIQWLYMKQRCLIEGCD